MSSNNWGNVYTRIGVRPLINAVGNQTVLGGSTPSPLVMQAMAEAGASYVRMEELLEKSGEYIAKLLGVEAAYITCGCYSAMVLSTAACMTGNDPDKRSQLPDTTGLKNEFLIQKRHRYGYDRAYTVPGSKLLEIGDDNGLTSEQLRGAIGPKTAAVIYLVQADPGKGVPSLGQTVEIAHAHKVLVIADAASQIYPIDYFLRNARSADLVCFGGKYFNAPHSTGFVVGRKDLIEAVVAHGFIGPRPIGRGMKLDRQEIIGLVTALEAWFAMDHEKRWLEYTAKYSVIEQKLAGNSKVREIKAVRNKSHYMGALHVALNKEALGKNAQQVAKELDEGTPCIKVGTSGEDTITINVYTLNEGEEQIIADRLKQILG